VENFRGRRESICPKKKGVRKKKQPQVLRGKGKAFLLPIIGRVKKDADPKKK